MNFLLIGTLLGSLISSAHDTRESCEGRAVLLREKGASVQCVTAPMSVITFGSDSNSNLTCNNKGCVGGH